MLEIIKGIVDILKIGIDKLFVIEIDLYDNVKVSLGVLIVAFIFIISMIYIIINALGFYEGREWLNVCTWILDRNVSTIF